jgi:hypothetical protein
VRSTLTTDEERRRDVELEALIRKITEEDSGDSAITGNVIAVATYKEYLPPGDEGGLINVGSGGVPDSELRLVSHSWRPIILATRRRIEGSSSCSPLSACTA